MKAIRAVCVKAARYCVDRDITRAAFLWRVQHAVVAPRQRRSQGK